MDAWCHLRDDLRNFSLDAVTKVEVMEAAAKELADKKMVRPGNLWVVFDGSIVQRVGFSSCTVNASAMDKSPVHRTSLWTAASRCVTCPPLLDLKPTV
jgi:hypothetical protein